MTASLEKLEKQFHRIAQLDHATTFLGWDQMVMMPNAGMAPRSAAMAELASMRHELISSDAMGEWLEDATRALNTGELDTENARHVLEMQRTWQQAKALPADLVHAQVIAGSKCEHAWRTQKSADDWAGFLENFREVVALSREEARCRQAQRPDDFATPYDALLDLHCTGDSQALISTVFSTLKAAQL